MSSGWLTQFAQAVLVLALAPLLSGVTRKIRARLLRRRGASVIQPYRDLVKLIRKEAVVAENASWLFRAAPYLVFAATWVAATLVPTFATELTLNAAADIIVIVALLGTARFLLALAGLDVGTSFGGIGSSREMLFASLAEPAMLMAVFTLSLFAGSTQLSSISAYMQGPSAGLSISLALALVALVIVAIGENARIPVDNPATHLELTMVHEAMILEYSGRHLAVIEAAASLKLLLYLSLIACVFAPWGTAVAGDGAVAYAMGFGAYALKLAFGAFLLVLFETSIAKMRVFRVPEFLGVALMLGPARHDPAVRLEGIAVSRPRHRHRSPAGRRSIVLVSFLLLYQDRMFALLNTFAIHACVLALSVGWQAYVQHAPHLFITALIALLFKGVIIPVALHRIVVRLGIHRTIEYVREPWADDAVRMALVALVHRRHDARDARPRARSCARIWRSRSSVVLLGFLMMVTRRNAVSQVIGFMSLENGLVLAATGARGMPLVVEISVGFSVLIAFIVVGIFLFRIRERFDSVDLQALDMSRGESS